MKHAKDRPAAYADESVPTHVSQNIEQVAALFAEVERRVGRHQRAIERLAAAVGRPAAMYVLAALVAGWTIGNALAPQFGVVPFDRPPYPWLQGAANVAALLITITILTTQSRLAKLADQRASLDLQVNLIAEQKIAKLIALVEELRRDLPSVRNRKDPLADAMTEAVDAHAVASKIEKGRPDGGSER